MKKKILSLSMFVIIAINSAFANEVPVNQNVLAAFSEQFTEASEVNWQKTKSYYIASFEFNGQHLIVFFTEEGATMGIKRNLTTLELPINLQLMLKKKYSGYWVSELCEYASD